MTDNTDRYVRGLQHAMRTLETNADDLGWVERDMARAAVSKAIESALAATRTAAAPDLHAALMALNEVYREACKLGEHAYLNIQQIARPFAGYAATVSASTAAPVARSEEQSSVHPAAPSSPSSLREVPQSEPCASEPSARPVRLSDEQIDGGCNFAGLGRGDCEHFVGLPGRSIPGQHDGPDDTIDHCGKPNGWCWSCWKSHQLEVLRAAAPAWHPIATAPKDGTVVRLFCEGFIDPDFNPGGSVEGFWLEGIGWMGAVWDGHRDCWDTREDIQPTRWMPLPPAPDAALATPVVQQAEGQQ